MRWGLLVPGMLVWAACASVGGGRSLGEEEDAAPIVRELTLHVTNQNFYDATLYAVSEGGVRQRLGVTRGFAEETFRFRWSHQELRIVIDFLATRATITEPLSVSAGDELALTIQPDAHRR